MVLLQAVFLAAWPLVTALPSNLTRLYYNGSAAKSHSTTIQYRQLHRLPFLRKKKKKKHTHKSDVFIYVFSVRILAIIERLKYGLNITIHKYGRKKVLSSICEYQT